jgi:hypothetical protein
VFSEGRINSYPILRFAHHTTLRMAPVAAPIIPGELPKRGRGTFRNYLAAALRLRSVYQEFPQFSSISYLILSPLLYIAVSCISYKDSTG